MIKARISEQVPGTGLIFTHLDRSILNLTINFWYNCSMFRVLLFTLLSFATVASAQTGASPLATAKGRTFTAADLSPEGQAVFKNQKKTIESGRAALFGQMIAETLLELEAKAVASTPDKLVAAERSKVATPAPAQIQAVYDANKSDLGNRTLSEVRDEIVAFLRREPEQKALQAYFDLLKGKHKFTTGKNVNAADLTPLDIIASFTGRQITAQQFASDNRFAINETLHHIYENLRADLETAVLNALIEEEAKAKNTQPNNIIATEVTDKMREFSEAERAGLEAALMDRLFTKYEVKFFLKEPEVIAQNVSADDDPASGPVSASVTVVMFSDFQCPACARTHPVLKRVIAEFDGKVRFVVRDYPLESIHADAFNAALAANAANKQGKYLEYSERLYGEQSSLDKPSLLKLAGELGLNVKQFEIDFTDAKAAAEIRKDKADGESYGVSSTPTIFVNGVKVHSLSAGAFRRAINRTLFK